jgi:hypothetical protein
VYQYCSSLLLFIVTTIITTTNICWVGCLKRQQKVFLHCRYRDLYLDLQDTPGLFGGLHLLFVVLDRFLACVPQALLREAESYGVFGRAHDRDFSWDFGSPGSAFLSIWSLTVRCLTQQCVRRSHMTVLRPNGQLKPVRQSGPSVSCLVTSYRIHVVNYTVYYIGLQVLQSSKA